jgi:hypothetical protein
MPARHQKNVWNNVHPRAYQSSHQIKARTQWQSYNRYAYKNQRGQIRHLAIRGIRKICCPKGNQTTHKEQQLQQIISQVCQFIFIFFCVRALSSFQIVLELLLAATTLQLDQIQPKMDSQPRKTESDNSKEENKWNMYRDKSASPSDNEEPPASASTTDLKLETPTTPVVAAAPIQYVAITQQLPGYSIDKFSGDNISQFLEDYDTFADIYQLQGLNKIKTIMAYCSPKYREIIKLSKPYKQAIEDHD